MNFLSSVVSIEEEETMNTERYLRGEKQTQRLTGELAPLPQAPALRHPAWWVISLSHESPARTA